MILKSFFVEYEKYGTLSKHTISWEAVFYINCVGVIWCIFSPKHVTWCHLNPLIQILSPSLHFFLLHSASFLSEMIRYFQRVIVKNHEKRDSDKPWQHRDSNLRPPGLSSISNWWLRPFGDLGPKERVAYDYLKTSKSPVFFLPTELPVPCLGPNSTIRVRVMVGWKKDSFLSLSLLVSPKEEKFNFEISNYMSLLFWRKTK